MIKSNQKYHLNKFQYQVSEIDSYVKIKWKMSVKKCGVKKVVEGDFVKLLKHSVSSDHSFGFSIVHVCLILTNHGCFYFR